MIKSDLYGALSRAYCHEKNKGKVLDNDLLEAIADEILLLYCKKQGKLHSPQWVTKYISFSTLDSELNAFTEQGYGIAKIHLMPAGDYLVVAKKGFVGGVM